MYPNRYFEFLGLKSKSGSVISHLPNYCSISAGIIVVKPKRGGDVEAKILDYFNYGQWSKSLPHLGLGEFCCCNHLCFVAVHD